MLQVGGHLLDLGPAPRGQAGDGDRRGGRREVRGPGGITGRTVLGGHPGPGLGVGDLVDLAPAEELAHALAESGDRGAEHPLVDRTDALVLHAAGDVLGALEVLGPPVELLAGRPVQDPAGDALVPLLFEHGLGIGRGLGGQGHVGLELGPLVGRQLLEDGRHLLRGRRCH